jgi:inner membrane protein
MEPVTHLLAGACLGRSGLNRRTALATFAAILAAEAPDLDEVFRFGGPVTELAHHRGITHTLVAAPFMALSITGLVWGLQKAWRALPFVRTRLPLISPQPVNWLWIYLTALLSDLMHLLLDWTNNYGIRPFFPFNARWYSGDLVFIAEPILWIVFLAALIVPALLGLADSEIGSRHTRFRGRGWAIFALTAMVLLWCWRWAEHAHARNLVDNSSLTQQPVRRVALEPYPFNPFRWHAILETDSSWVTAEVDTHRDLVVSDPQLNTLSKPAYTPSVIVARKSRLGQVYLDWSQWPVVRDIGPVPAPGDPGLALAPRQTWTTVEFHDLRFAYPILDSSMVPTPAHSLAHQVALSPLSGQVYVINGNGDAGEFLNGREQK